MGYAPVMPFPPADLAVLSESEEVEIETRVAPDAPVHRTIIWVMTDGPDAFVRSVRGSRGRWYREAIANPEVAVHAAGRRLPARAVPASDPHSIERTKKGLRDKYEGIAGYREMLEPDVLDTTLRLEPA
jgi:hypothetical protein